MVVDASPLLLYVKDLLRQRPWANVLNARLKAAQTRRRIAQHAQTYAARSASIGFRYSESWALQETATRLAARALSRRPTGSDRLNVFWVGGNWDQDNSGFLASLQQMAEVTWARTRSGAYGYCQIVPGRPFRPWHADMLSENAEVLLEQVRAAHARRPLHLLWGQMWSNYIPASMLDAIRAMGIVVMNVALDDRLPEHWDSYDGRRLGAIGLGPACDLVLTTSPECCAWYGVEGVPAIFWPMASDPQRFGPGAEDAKRHDVSFVGNRYGIRARIVEGLIRAGIHVEAFGAGWANGPIGAERASEVFAESRIILGVGTIAHNEDLFTLKLRDFDATMAGGLYLTHRNPDLLQLFEEGREIECYDSLDECIQKARYYLSHPEERQRVARAGLTRARRDHTWTLRIEAALRAVGLYD